MSVAKKRSARSAKTPVKKGVLSSRRPPVAAANDPAAWPLFQLLPTGSPPFMGDGEAVTFQPSLASDEPLREFGVWQQWHQFMLSDAAMRSARLWGVVSPHFHAKTGLTTALIRHAIATKPDFDVYLISPTPELEGVYSNLWLQGATVHPDLLVHARKLLAAVDLPDTLTDLQPSTVFCTGLHAVATPTFWAAYDQFIGQVVEQGRRKLSKRTLRSLAEAVPDPLRLYHGATYWSVTLERLMPVFLKTAGMSFRRTRLPVPLAEQRMNVHLRKLREMKDVAHHTQSKWLATCWVHYRNAYLQGVLTREWCDTHLADITPKDIQFY